MLSSVKILLVVMAAQQTQPTIVQKSSGWCSPNIANVVGNVTVNCIGVDPRALKRLNAELGRKDLQLADKIREADEWTAKYKELESRLGQAGDDSVLSRQAEEYLHEGELEKAGAVLDQILAKEEKEVDLIAANQYNRGLVFELQFQPVEALPHLAKAYQYRPEELNYGQRYSYVLLKQHDFNHAEPVLLATIERARQLAKANPAAYQADVAETLNNLGLLYRATERTKEAEGAYREALETYRQLAKANPAAYQPYVAAALNNMANLYRDTQRLKEAEGAYQEALDIRRQLAKSNRAAYQRYVAESLNNLANLYTWTQREKEAEAAYQEALDNYRQLAKANPAAYQPYVATVLNNLGLLYRETQRMKEAEGAYQQALEIRRQLAKENPPAYEPDLADTQAYLGDLYRATQRMKEAEGAYQEALETYRQLAKANPTAYRPYLANTLYSLTMLYVQAGNLALARTEVEEEVSVNRQLWTVNQEAAGDALAKSLTVDAMILSNLHEPSSTVCPLLREAGAVAYDPEVKRRVAATQAKVCSAP